MEIEIWKDIPGYEGIYQVSDLGRVKSVDREVMMKGKYPYIKNGKIRKQFRYAGYFSLKLHNGSKFEAFKVHRLVAMAFLNHVSDGTHKLVVNHIDFNKSNNRADNLEIITQRENANKIHIKSSSQYTGVHWHKIYKKWRASIYLNGKSKFLGLFENEIDASNAYQKSLKEINNG